MSYQSEVLADTPVAYWRLGDTSGTTAADTSGNSHPATYNNATLNATGLVSGDSDKAVTFNGSSSYVDAGSPSALQITGVITVEAIIKCTTLPTTGNFENIVSKGFDSTNVGYFMDVRRTAGGQLQLAAGSYQSSGDIDYRATADISWSAGETHHVVGRYDGSNWVLFIDGVQVASTAAASGARSTTSFVYVGSMDLVGTNGRFFTGTIDEVAVYNSALTSTRILAHATAAGLASGALSAGASGATATSASAITASSSSATGGTAPYSYQFQRAPDSSGSPGTFANVGSAQTGLSLGVAPTNLSDTGLTASTKYWYRCVVTDSAGSPATANSTPASATTFSGSAPTVTALVPSHGATVDMTFSAAVTGVAAADYHVSVNGYRVDVTGVSGSGTAWSLALGQRWLNPGQTVLLSYSGTATVDAGTTPLATFSNRSLTNSSITVDRFAQHVGAKLGMFVCFNLNTFVPGGDELPDGTEDGSLFAPTDLDIDQWIDAAQLMGARYIVLTVKHHGGYCIWPTSTTGYGIASTAWYASTHIDVVRQFTTKCRARGMAVGLYFSVWDRNWESAHSGFTSSDYTQHTVDQITELLTQYGPVDILWTDGWGWAGGTPTGWDVGYSVVPYATIYSLIKSLQPNCILIENNHEGTTAHSDILENEFAVDGAPPSNNVYPMEECQTIRSSGNWFYFPGDTANMSVSTVLSNLSSINSRRAAYLLNFPPDQTGKIPAADMYLISQIGSGVLKPPYSPLKDGGGINGSGILGML